VKGCACAFVVQSRDLGKAQYHPAFYWAGF